jgi:hypothetical protein
VIPDVQKETIMGLDSYFTKPARTERKRPQVADDLAWPEANLCGGLFSGNGQGSFRGKVYEGIFAAATGDTLYHEAQDAAWVADMAGRMESYIAAFADAPDVLPVHNDPWTVTAQEARDLAAIFRFAADSDLGYHGWW